MNTYIIGRGPDVPASYLSKQPDRNKYTIIMRSAPKCDYCERAKALLDSKGIKYELIDLAGRETAIRVFKALGCTTVPLIIDSNSRVIGGYDDLVEYLE